MKILTLNTWNEQGPWQDRWEIAFAELGQIEPDVVAFQEVISSGWAETISRRLGLPHYIFSGAAYGLLTLSRYPIRSFELMPYATKSPTENDTRAILRTNLQRNSSDLVIFNTHLSWRPEEGTVRKGQIRELLRWADAHASDRDLLALGDFNAHEDQPEIKAMTQRGGFVDSFRRVCPDEPGLTWDNHNCYTASHGLPDRRLDYIFVRPRGRTLGPLQKVALCCHLPGAQGIFASDHHGLWASFAS